MLDISKAFTTQGEPVCEFFQRPGVGFYIPLYQRDYTWNNENIDQLMEDICHGVEVLAGDDDAIRFLGTVILVKENNPSANIQPRDNRALPTSIENIIDGQQRLSTIALLACLLYQRFADLSKKLPDEAPYQDIKGEIEAKQDTLMEIFSVDIKRGKPRRKPIIIRGSKDCWTYDGREEDNYISDVSSFLARFISACENKREFPQITGTGRVAGNLRQMNRWLERVANAHKGDEDSILTAPEILEKIPQEHIWAYDRDELTEIVKNIDFDNITKQESLLCSIVQLFAFYHYLLYRCCFTSIQPSSDDWAFDMFQSLNASGTPLTSIETFKPIVVNCTESYKGSSVEEDFSYVDELLDKVTSDAKKNRFTNEFLTSLALVISGYKLSSQFSAQRRWLTNEYMALDSKKALFIQRMGQHARFYINIQEHKPQSGAYKGLERISDDQMNLIFLLVKYLKDSGHKMANTILSRFYSEVLSEKENSAQNFCDAVKAIAAFYTLWRAADTNAGLDNVYRTLLKGDADKGIPSFSWAGNASEMTVANLKIYLKKELDKKSLGTKEEWLKKAKMNLRYDKAKFVCRFALLVAAHDTITDENFPGLMKIGTLGCNPCLDVKFWDADDLSDIEHIAPGKPRENADWDKNIYTDEYQNTIGNLTLLPEEINESASNKGWAEKYYYYKHLAETDVDKVTQLAEAAKNDGITLKDSVIGNLRNATHNEHIVPIVNIGKDGKWNAELIQQRSERICEILWERVKAWLEA